jgi:site-specific DNA recombinase
VTEPLDGSPEGMLIRFVRGWVAQLEVAKIRERTVRGRRAKVLSGRITPGAKYLYGYTTDRDRRTRAIQPEHAQVVASIFEWVDQGIGLREIMRGLNLDAVSPPSLGHFTYRDGRVPRWGRVTLWRIIREPAYKGEAFGLRRGSRKPKPDQVTGRRSKWRQVEYRDQADWIAMPEGNTPPIVTPELWERVQRRLTTNTGETSHDAERPYLLRGLIACAVCGKKMRSNLEHGRTTYRCSSRETASGACGGKRTPGDEVEAEVWLALTSLWCKPAVMLDGLLNAGPAARPPRVLAMPGACYVHRVDWHRRRPCARSYFTIVTSA